jgi:hypothetical protein
VKTLPGMTQQALCLPVGFLPAVKPSQGAMAAICAGVAVFVLVAGAGTAAMGFADTAKAKTVKDAKVDKNFIVNSVECVTIRWASSVEV